MSSSPYWASHSIGRTLNEEGKPTFALASAEPYPLTEMLCKVGYPAVADFSSSMRPDSANPTASLWSTSGSFPGSICSASHVFQSFATILKSVSRPSGQDGSLPCGLLGNPWVLGVAREKHC